ncbi:hypothetical protein [Runella aurantiaca]|uniref:Uncharacterized protein n=1 Tax=Runella aurantiaca TaxID=2282308 RepID=A0A369IFX1_9BACT|nr:hypothetical protein [Runella aurantiaca]RDB07207.1 hypothetical protein DVG78_04075 [Runella aurantiaca]
MSVFASDVNSKPGAESSLFFCLINSALGNVFLLPDLPDDVVAAYKDLTLKQVISIPLDDTSVFVYD